MAAQPLYIDSDQILFLKNCKDKDGNYVNDGIVTYTIESKQPVDGIIEEIDSGTLSFVSDGRYEKILDKGEIAGIEEGRHYYITIIFTNPGGKDLKKKIEVYGAYS